MNYREESLHIESLFRQLDDAGKIKLVTQLRDKAIEYLQPVINKVPRHFSDDAIAAYKARRISVEWNLTTLEAYEFYGMARKAGLSSSQQYAAQLLDVCTEALEKNTVTDRMQRYILDAYAGLDDDAINNGENYSRNQSKKASNLRGKVTEDGVTIGELIGGLALSCTHKDVSAKKLWPHFLSKLDELGLDPKDISEGTSIVIEYYSQNELKKLNLKTFENTISNYRTGKKSL